VPCTTEYEGKTRVTKKTSFTRTQLDINLEMKDENGKVQGYVRSQTDGSVKAICLDQHGNPMSERNFFLVEQPEDQKMCDEKGYIPIVGNGETIIKSSQEWLTKEYQTYKHSLNVPIQQALNQWG
jgi:hypothetical protein